MDSAGRIAVVTGAAAATARAIALRLAAEGAFVLVADVDARGGEATVSEIERRGGRASRGPTSGWRPTSRSRPRHAR
jgi:NAD(P)-dependent dehydrogenase (short-subunit alcohol dehydrogenase family)